MTKYFFINISFPNVRGPHRVFETPALCLFCTNAFTNVVLNTLKSKTLKDITVQKVKTLKTLI